MQLAVLDVTQRCYSSHLTWPAFPFGILCLSQITYSLGYGLEHACLYIQRYLLLSRLLSSFFRALPCKYDM